MKRPWLILFGIGLGVVGVFVYQVFGRPTMPKVEKHNVTFRFTMPRLGMRTPEFTNYIASDLG